MNDDPDKVVQLDPKLRKVRAAIKDAKPRAAKDKKTGGDAGNAPPPPPTSHYGPPDILPDDAPVTALGTLGGLYFYIDALGQVRQLKEPEHGRTQILGLFGGKKYLAGIWPEWRWVKGAVDGEGAWEKTGDFKHGLIAPVLIESCHRRGLFDPANKVRGCGTWIEDDGSLVMHCGRYLWRSVARTIEVRVEPGLYDGLLYPRRPALPEPDLAMGEDFDDAGPRTLEMIRTWNWKRGDLDAMIILAWIVAALLGQAPVWRPALWVSGGKSTGKSTLKQLIEWIIGKTALVMPDNTTQAFVYQSIGDSSLPVLLDEFEAKDDNRRVQDVIDLMRIAASGGTLGRGGSENNPKNYTLKSCFAAFSILIPPLAPQDMSRLAICHLGKLRRPEDAEAPELDLNAPDDMDMVLGSKARWARTGRQLRGRVLREWPRYPRTYKAYFQAMMITGHEHRAAAQFGALGAAFDIAMFKALEERNVRDWVALLPSADLAETKSAGAEPENCLHHLLAATPDMVRHGTRETIAFYLRQARTDIEHDKLTNDPDDAVRVLAKIGIRVVRDREMVTANAMGRDEPVWWVCVSNTHPALGEIFRGTHWRGRPGSRGTWAQALGGLAGAAEKASEMRIDGPKHWVTKIMWGGVFPPFGEYEDADEIASVMPDDREKSEREIKAKRSFL